MGVKNIPGIPTLYRGRQYRSRLEARWAAFFDLLKWDVEYEPCDFNGWIPDFVISGKDIVYVEVKPVSRFPEDVAAKLERSGCENEMLIIGQTFIKEWQLGMLPTDDNEYAIGWLAEVYPAGVFKVFSEPNADTQFCWSEAPLGRFEANTIGFCHSAQSYHDRITGEYFGSWGLWDGRIRDIVEEAWTEAGNIVQWSKAVTA